MSFNLEVQGGKNYLLPTGGKYCPQDIAIAAIGGGFEIAITNNADGTQSLAITDSNGAEIDVSKVVSALSYNGDAMKLLYDLPPIGTTLQNATWAQISGASKAEKAQNYWSVGDTKSVVIGGVTYTIEIIGFSHDVLADGSGKAGITFAMKDCLNATYQMNTANTNAGGWGGSALRNTLQGTIFNQLPADMRMAIRAVNKKASAGSQSTTINEYPDTLFLLSEIEVFGGNTYCVPGEGTQYSIFADSTSRIKKMNGAATNWWLRSPFKSNTTYFGRVNYMGSADGLAANGANAVAFAFCV